MAAAVAWTFANVSIQTASRRFGAFGALVWAQALGTPLTFAAAAIVEGTPGVIDGTTAAAVVIAAVAALAAYVGLFESLGKGQLAVVTPIITAWSVISVAVGVLMFDEQLDALRWVGIGCVVAGNVVLAATTRGAPEPGGSARDHTPPYAVWMALLSALGFGVLVPAVDVAGAGMGRLWAVPSVWIVELAIGVPLLLAFKALQQRPRGRGDWLVAGRVGVLEGLGFVMLSLALGLAPMSVVSPVASLSTGFSVLWGVLILRERIRSSALGGALLASAGVVLVST